MTEALYAVESWYSWHSREDYSNNIVSICNAFCGVRSEALISGAAIDKTQVAAQSLYTVLVSNGQQELADNTLSAIKNAYDKILAIRNRSVTISTANRVWRLRKPAVN